MDINFSGTEFPPERQGEIDDVLRRIQDVNRSQPWQDSWDEIRVLRQLAGGRSGCEVLEVVVKKGPREAHKVIKLGPIHELENEFSAFDKHLREANDLFVRIQATTPGVRDKSLSRSDEREAVVYDHAARFRGGMPPSELQTFEHLAREAVACGGATLERAITALEKFFQGVRNDLYEKCETGTVKTTLQAPWNRRLGVDAVLEISHVDKGRRKLTSGAGKATLRARDIAQASVRTGSKAAPGDLVQLSGARMVWWGDHLMAEVDAHHLRVEVVAGEDDDIHLLASVVNDGSKWTISGRLASLRAATHRDRLLNGLGGDFSLSGETLSGPGARVRDPFAALPGVMEGRRPRITALIHGDLNPRNILVVGKDPCLIDYAFTRPDKPIFMDFGRLEGCLARDVLPADLGWAQHVRLQRLLAAACRLGDDAARRFAERLADERAELEAAFRLLWTIRRAAREVYPPDRREQWVQDHAEQLFLFAHLTLKWDNAESLAPEKLRATAAISGVATETLAGTGLYRRWGADALRGDGREIVHIVGSQPGARLREVADLARALRRLAASGKERGDDELRREFERVRADYVRQSFRNAARATLDRLDSDHDVYISLRAYIDLKGQLSAGRERRRERLRFEDMLESDELLAESERLRAGSGADADALHLIAANPAVVLIGDAGSGKSTVAREWEFRLAQSIVGDAAPGADETPTLQIEPRVPIFLRAPALPERLKNWKADKPRSTAALLPYAGLGVDLLDLLAAGALYVVVDALNEVDDEQKRLVADWIVAMRATFPDAPMLVCHRQYNYVPGLLPFPVVTLQTVENEQARSYVRDYLREKNVPDHAQLADRLVKLLLDSPDHAQVRDLAQTPLFLWMIVERYRQTGEPPTSRGGLFDTFSRWYLEQRYHEAHEEVTATRYSYEIKALLLGALGYELVQRRATSIAVREIGPLVPRRIKNRWRKVMDEIVAAEMLLRDGDEVRFLHQSFQEYFAARRFLDQEAGDPQAVRQKVWQLGWHDTFAVLLGFAGDEVEVVTRVIEAAMDVNPSFTARCLRVAELSDRRLLERFVAAQQALLQDPGAGRFLHRRAAEALAEYGRGVARAALWQVAVGPDAPEAARVAALEQLAGMPAQMRLEAVAVKIRGELANRLPQVFDEPAPVAVQQAAIAAIVSTELKDLAAYLADLVAGGEWPLRRAAWQACDKLGLKLTPRQHVTFVAACRERLDRAEEELYRETVEARWDELNEERMDILRQLATPANLSLLLERRFRYDIHDKIGVIVDQVARAEGEPPAEAQAAWAVLAEQPGEDTAAATDRWLELLRGPDDLTAAAAAHCLAQLGKNLPGEKLRPFLDLSLSPDRLSAIARLVAVCQNESLTEPLEAFVRSLIETVTGSEEFEAFANLVEALKALDSRLGNRVAAVASAIFWTDRDEVEHHDYFPWRMVYDSIYLRGEDYQTLLAAGGDDAWAAVFRLSTYGAGTLRVAGEDYSTKLDADAMQQLCNLAKSEREPYWQYCFACAAVNVHAVDLLPWLIELADSPEMAEGQVTNYDSQFGVIENRFLSYILRATGYLAHVLLNEQRAEEAQPTVALLRERYAALRPDEERSIVIGLTTGLGFLGDWEPVLAHLGPGEPWMHEAARNIFEHWVPTPLDPAPPGEQREAAARWIVRRLRDCADLAPEVRSTLERCKDLLETQLGRHVRVDEG